MPPSAISSIDRSGTVALAAPHPRMGEHANHVRAAGQPERVRRLQGVLRHVRESVVGDVAMPASFSSATIPTSTIASAM